MREFDASINFMYFVNAGVTVAFTNTAYNLTENQNVLVCTQLSGSMLARNVSVTLHLNSTEGRHSE